MNPMNMNPMNMNPMNMNPMNMNPMNMNPMNMNPMNMNPMNMNQMNINPMNMNPLNINNMNMNPMNMNPMNLNPMNMNPMNMNQMNMNPMNMNPMNMNPMNMNPMDLNQMNMNPMNMNPMNMNPMDLNQMNMNPMNMNQMNMNPMNMNQMNIKEIMDDMVKASNLNKYQSFFNDRENQIKVEEFKINLHPDLKARKKYNFNLLFQNFNEKKINIYRCSMDSFKKIEICEHPVLTAYYLAFLDHYPVVLSPDILWMLILEGFSHHVKLNANILRNKFVKTNSKSIVITQSARGDNNINKVSENRWGDIFKNFVEQSKEKIDGTLLHLFTPYFSTTTTDIEYASQIAIVSIISPFVKFIKKFRPNISGGCGFPYINLQGALQDYKQLKIKVEGLKGYFIDDWVKKIMHIIDKIIETKKGNIDKHFWDNMITNQKREYSERVQMPSSSSFTTRKKIKIEIFGWIFDFFPYKNVFEGVVQLSQEEQKDGLRHGKVYTLKRNDIKIYEDSNFDMLPDEMIELEANYRNRRSQTALIGIKSGFLGYSLNSKNEFKPEIGWYFYIKDDPFSLLI